MLWGRKASGPDKKAASAKQEDLDVALGGAGEVERLEKELATFRKKGVKVRMETGADGRKVLVPEDPASGKDKK